MKDKPIEKAVINKKNAAYSPSRGEVEALKTHLTITDEQRQQFSAVIKIGVYRELYHRGLLNGKQLDLLLQHRR